MKIRAVSSPSVSLTAGQTWDMLISVRSASGRRSEDVITAVARPPGGASLVPLTTLTEDHYAVGVYGTSYVPLAAGRHLVTFTGVYAGSYTFAAYVTAAVDDSGLPSLFDLVGDRSADHPGYLGSNSWSDDEVQDALDAESAAQRRLCRIPAAYPADLRQALLRRVARNLSMRRAPLAVLRGDAEGGDTSVLPGSDPEIRRLERPHRRLKVG